MMRTPGMVSNHMKPLSSGGQTLIPGQFKCDKAWCYEG